MHTRIHQFFCLQPCHVHGLHQTTPYTRWFRCTGTDRGASCPIWGAVTYKCQVRKHACLPVPDMQLCCRRCLEGSRCSLAVDNLYTVPNIGNWRQMVVTLDVYKLNCGQRGLKMTHAKTLSLLRVLWTLSEPRRTRNWKRTKGKLQRKPNNSHFHLMQTCKVKM